MDGAWSKLYKQQYTGSHLDGHSEHHGVLGHHAGDDCAPHRGGGQGRGAGEPGRDIPDDNVMTIIMTLIMMAFLMVTFTVRLLARLGREVGRSGGVLLSWTRSRRPEKIDT